TVLGRSSTDTIKLSPLLQSLRDSLEYTSTDDDIEDYLLLIHDIQKTEDLEGKELDIDRLRTILRDRHPHMSKDSIDRVVIPYSLKIRRVLFPSEVARINTTAVNNPQALRGVISSIKESI